jgi:hypothetical protein
MERNFIPHPEKMSLMSIHSINKFLPEDIHPAYIKRVLQGENSALLFSFTWGSSPQGYDYWLFKTGKYTDCKGQLYTFPLDKKDILYLEVLVLSEQIKNLYISDQVLKLIELDNTPS